MEVKGVLPMGLEYAGKVHKEFSLRPAIVKDNIEALEETEGQGNIQLGLAKLARQITRLGDIPSRAISTELLIDLYEADLEAMQEAQENLEKKARGLEINQDQSALQSS